MTYLGWIGGILLGICAFPQVYHTVRSNKANDISGLFLILWGLGEGLTLIYVIPQMNWPLIVNYLLNLIFIGIITKVKYEKNKIR
jgi:uncharacterized protein with PQ loop repeat